MNETIRMFTAKRLSKSACIDWAELEFGKAKLGDARRARRLVQMGTRAAMSPGGPITKVFNTSADRESAYRFVENDSVEANEINRAASLSCFERIEDSYVFVPVDGSTLSLTAAKDNPNFGPVGTKKTVMRGVEAMSAIVVAPDGTPIGAGAQRFWVRTPSKLKKKRNRPIEEKETRFWLEVLEETVEAHRQSKSSVRPWFQLDRAGDFHEALSWASVADVDFTTRACHDRKVLSSTENYLWETIQKHDGLGTYQLKIASGPKRKARTATIEIKSCPVVLPLRDGIQVELYAVYAREVSPVPPGQEPIDWMLLTNREVTDFVNARLVVFGYSQRWRIEEVHKSWKSTCQIETSALEELETFSVWAAMLFIVAVRIERLKRLARTSPEKPASVEFSSYEIQAIIALKDLNALNSDRMLTIGQAVLWIAELGGYTGKSSGGPAGSITIGRGLQKVEPIAQMLKSLNNAGLKIMKASDK